jgi:hypothetical protein
MNGQKSSSPSSYPNTPWSVAAQVLQRRRQDGLQEWRRSKVEELIKIQENNLERRKPNLIVNKNIHPAYLDQADHYKKGE